MERPITPKIIYFISGMTFLNGLSAFFYSNPTIPTKNIVVNGAVRAVYIINPIYIIAEGILLAALAYFAQRKSLISLFLLVIFFSIRVLQEGYYLIVIKNGSFIIMILFAMLVNQIFKDFQAVEGQKSKSKEEKSAESSYIKCSECGFEQWSGYDIAVPERMKYSRSLDR
jgi:hypothetical protein